MRRGFPTLSSKAFVSLALTLGVALAGTNAASAQQRTLVSSASDGTPGNDASSSPSISSDGRFVAFQSAATNLVTGDTNGKADVFVKDRLSGTTTRVSVTSTGVQNVEPSGGVRISGNGRFVLFHTLGQLVAEDTSNCGTAPAVAPCADIYVHDLDTSATTLVTLSSTGVQANNISEAIDISADGRFVLFRSMASNLAPNDTNNDQDLFLRDRQLGTTTLVSRDQSGIQLPHSDFGLHGRMSADGRFIVYGPGAQGATIYVYERETGTVSIASDAFPARNGSTYRPLAITDDGRVIVVSEQFSLPGFSLPFVAYWFHDRLTGHMQSGGGSIASPMSMPFFAGISGDGRIYSTRRFSMPVSLADRVNGSSETILDITTGEDTPLSADGRFMAFVGAGIYVYDRDSGDGDGMPSAWETTFGLNPENLTDANADTDLDGVPNLQEYIRGTHPTALATATRYFAEGASNAFFLTRFAAVNPGDEKATVVFRFLGSGGQTSSVLRTIEPRSRITLELPATGPTPSDDFSTVIESDRLVVVDRTMTWDGTGYGAHTETALTAPLSAWYLAEGATHGAFDLFYLLQNPNDSDAHVVINYLRQAPLTPVTRSYTVDRNSRKTIWVDAEGSELDAVDTAASITSDLPIVAERAMYSSRVGQPPFAAGHGAAAVGAPALRWFLAEGATGNFFDLFVLVGNPNTTQSNLKVTYLLPSGTPIERTYSVGPQQRLTINVQDQDALLDNTPVSVIVESTNNQPVVVERAMWWPKGEWYESHVSAGATTTGTKWALADGEVTVGGDTYILIANTSTTAGSATVTLLEEGGTPLPITLDLQPSSRRTISVSEYLPPTGSSPRRFGTLIESNGVEIVVERSIYTTVGGITWSAGTAALGTKLQ